MRLILVRHGETVENATGISQGQSHGSLSSRGHQQARQVAERLRDISLDHVYASDLKRVVDTAAEIMKHHHDTEIRYTKALREITRGKFDGGSKSAVREKMAQITQPICDYRWEGGESMRDVQKRVLDLFHKVHAYHPDGTVAFVSHGGPISCLIVYLLDESLEERRSYAPQNTGLTIIDVLEDGRNIERLNCIEHLE